MAQLEDREINELISRRQRQYEGAGQPAPTLWRAVRETRQRGQAVIVDDVVPGLAGIGQTLAPELPAAISVGTITLRFTVPRQHELSALLTTQLRSRP